MKAGPFAYYAPTTLAEALALKAEHESDAAVLAGGQSLIPMLNMRLARPGVVIDLNRVPGLDGIETDDEGLSLGALVRQRRAERDASVADRAPLLARALLWIAHPAIRQRGTICGSLAHADPAAELPAVALALDAEVVAASAARGERRIAANDFFLGFLSTALEPDELVTGLRIPAGSQRSVAFSEVSRRHGDFALAGAAVRLRLTDGRITEARIAMNGVGATAVRGDAGEQALLGQAPSADLFADAAERATADLHPASDVHGSGAYRRRIAAVVVRRALAEAVTVTP
jgi:carbon-monoxide dehydrogenase medium subunit